MSVREVSAWVMVLVFGVVGTGCLASILRAGNGLLDGMLDLVPAARVAHIGMYRDHDTLEPIEYYFKAPGELENRLVIAVDPMLATGNSAIVAM